MTDMLAKIVNVPADDPQGVHDPLEVLERMTRQQRRAFDRRLAKYARMDIRNVEGERVFPATTHEQFLQAFRKMTFEQRVNYALDQKQPLRADEDVV
jgi:hypothetical protein